MMVNLPKSWIDPKKRKFMTNIEKDAWEVSDSLEKAIHFLGKTDLTEKIRRKIIRDMIKDNLIQFHKNESNTKEVQQS